MIRSVRELVGPQSITKSIRKSIGRFTGNFVLKRARFYVWASLAGLGLRALLVAYFPGVVDDSRFYANIAQNWLQHGVYGITNSGVVVPTQIRSMSAAVTPAASIARRAVASTCSSDAPSGESRMICCQTIAS